MAEITFDDVANGEPVDVSHPQNHGYYAALEMLERQDEISNELLGQLQTAEEQLDQKKLYHLGTAVYRSRPEWFKTI